MCSVIHMNKNLVAASGALIISVCFLFFSVPKFVSTLWEQKARPIVSSMRHGATLAQVHSVQALESLQKARIWDPTNPRVLEDIAFLRLRQASSLRRMNSEYEAIIHESIEEYQRVLLIEPMNARAWADLGAAYYTQQGRLDESALNALRMSFLTGRAETELLFFRLSFGLMHWHSLPADLRVSVISQVTYIWNIYRLRNELVKLYLEMGYEQRLLMFRALSTVGDQKEFTRRLHGQAG